MKPTHTPGPWEWTPGDCYGLGSECHRELVREGLRGDADSILYHGANWPMTDADAALIQAAPELLAALRGLLAAFDATCEAGRSGVSPAQAIAQREAARALLVRLDT